MSSIGRLQRSVVLITIVLIAAGVLVWRSRRAIPVAVVLAEVDQGRVERSVANTRAGTVNACRRARLAPPAGGQIVALPVREGDRVHAGQVLLELWNQDSAAQARVAEEQSRSAVLRAEEACGQADIAKRDADRASQLHRGGLLPDDQLDRAMSTAKTLR